MIFEQGRVSRKLTYSTESRRFARNSDSAQKARIWTQMEFCNYLNTLFCATILPDGLVLFTLIFILLQRPLLS